MVTTELVFQGTLNSSEHQHQIAHYVPIKKEGQRKQTEITDCKKKVSYLSARFYNPVTWRQTARRS